MEGDEVSTVRLVLAIVFVVLSVFALDSENLTYLITMLVINIFWLISFE